MRHPSAAPAHQHSATDTAVAVDPVCGMAVRPDRAAGRTVHAGREYLFCSTGCHRKFEADPARYAPADPLDHSVASPSAQAAAQLSLIHI